MRNLFIILILLFQVTGFSQELNVDSLQSVWKNKKLPDSVRLNALDMIAWDVYLYNIPESAFHYAQLQYELAAEKGSKKYQAIALNTQGASYYIRNEYDSAMKYHSLCLKLKEEMKDFTGMASSFNNIGVIYKDRGNYSEALKYYEKGLESYRKSNDKKGEAVAMNNMANVYADEGNYAKAIQFYTKSLTIRVSLNDEFGMASSWFNIGHIYADMHDYENAMNNYEKSLRMNEKISNSQGKAGALNGIGNIYAEKNENEIAMEYYEKSLHEYESIENIQGISNTLNSLGNMYFKMNKPDMALVYYQNSLKHCESSGDQQLMAHVSNNIGRVYTSQKKFGLAAQFGKQALLLAQQVGAAIEIRESAATLYKLYKLTGNINAALEMFELHISVRDSINKNENQREIINQKYKHEYEIQAAQDSVKNSEQQKIKDAEIARQQAITEKQDTELKNKRTQQYALFGGLSLVMIFSIFIYNRFRITQKQKLIIEQKEKETHHQKDIIEEKQKEITDSITYAKRIQYSLLAHKEMMDNNLGEYFVLFMPKDIVSGDFYWCTKKGSDFYLAICDSTGHGVPGAFMSLLNISFLNEAINEKNIESPDMVLNHVREKLISGMEGEKDGMDAILIRFTNRKIQYAAANNNPVLIRNGNLTELPADKMPVGKGEKSEPFTLHEIELKKDDLLFFYTDGFADQFGGPKARLTDPLNAKSFGQGKKFKYSNLQKLLVESSNEKPQTINEKLKTAFTEWKGELEQVDDVCIIGIRI